MPPDYTPEKDQKYTRESRNFILWMNKTLVDDHICQIVGGY